MERSEWEKLQRPLQRFLHLERGYQNNGLYKIWGEIDKRATLEAFEQLKVDRRDHSGVERAAGDASETKVEVEGKLVPIWRGDYAVVVVARSGCLVSGISKLSPDVRAAYGENLFPYALNKAWASLVADRRMGGGITEPDIFEEMKKLGFPNHTGSTRYPADWLGAHLYIGTSGCLPSDEYINYLPGIAFWRKERDVIPIAELPWQGLMDEWFAEIVRDNISNLFRDRRNKVVPEYEKIGLLRKWMGEKDFTDWLFGGGKRREREWYNRKKIMGMWM